MPTLRALKQAGLEYLLLDEAQAREAALTLREPARSTREEHASRTPPRKAPCEEAKAPQAVPDSAEWSAAWRERLQKTRATPVVWTYWELGRDLCVAPDPQRRELLQEILQALDHPPGTHCFWPAALPGRDGEPEANAPVFWEGVSLLHGRAVMIMGEQALCALDLPDRLRELHPFQQARHQGLLLVVLPPPDTLIREPRRLQALQEFLRQALAPFV